MKKIWMLAGAAVLLFSGSLRAQMTNNGLQVYIAAGLPVNLSGNVTNASGTLTNNGTLTAKNIVNNPGASLTGSGTFVVKGSFANTGLFGGVNTLSFEGGGPASIQTNGASVFKLLLNKTGSPRILYLADNLLITNQLNFTGANNKLGLNDWNLSVNPSTTINSASYSRYVITNSTGVFKRLAMPTGAFFTFPVGATADTYNPLEIRNTGFMDDIGVRCLPDALTEGDHGAVVAENAVNASWQITETTPSGSNLTVYAQWNATDEQPTFDAFSCALRHYDGPNWDPYPFPLYAPPTGNNPFKRGRASIFQLGYFAIFDNMANPKPPPPPPPTTAPDLASKFNITASPNPFAHSFRVEKTTASPARESRVTLQTAAGQTLRTLIWPPDLAFLEVDGSELPAGVYFLTVDFGEGQRTVLPVVKFQGVHIF